MFRKLLLLSVLLGATFASAAAYDPNGYNQSCSAVTTTGICSPYSLGANDAFNYSWQVYFDTGAAATLSVNIEWSIDGTHWWVADTTTTLAGEGRSVVNKGAHFLRCNVTTYTVGTSNNLSCGFSASR